MAGNFGPAPGRHRQSKEKTVIRPNDAQKIHELTLVDLDGVSGGRKDGGGPTVGKVFLTFRFDTVFTSK
jgi:hypothetical protein